MNLVMQTVNCGLQTKSALEMMSEQHEEVEIGGADGLHMNSK